jgi:sugar phosphate isomerase/epimerase
MVDVGSGAIDWRTLLGQAAAAGCHHWFVEHDEPRDAFASIAASHRYLAALDVPGV